MDEMMFLVLILKSGDSPGKLSRHDSQLVHFGGLQSGELSGQRRTLANRGWCKGQRLQSVK